MRKYKPVELPLRNVPDEYAQLHAVCPNCQSRDPFVIGRLGSGWSSAATSAGCASTGRSPSPGPSEPSRGRPRLHSRVVVIDPSAPASLLVVMAHPDDAEFSAGGTLARWTDAGVRVTYCVCTDGDKGTSDPSRDPREVAEQRIAEQR